MSEKLWSFYWRCKHQLTFQTCEVAFHCIWQPGVAMQKFVKFSCVKDHQLPLSMPRWKQNCIASGSAVETRLEGARESAYLCQVKWFKHKERGWRRKSHFAAREGGKCNSWHYCLCCWCNDVIAIMSHHVHRRNDRQTEWSIS